MYPPFSPQVDTAGLLRAQRAAAKSQATAQSSQSSGSNSHSHSSSVENTPAASASGVSGTTADASGKDGDDGGGSSSISDAAPTSPSQRRSPAGSGGRFGDATAGDDDGDNKADGDAAGLPAVSPEDVSVSVVDSIAAAAAAGLDGEEGGLLEGGDGAQAEAEGEGGVGAVDASDPSAARLEMLPMGAVAHLSRRDRLGIIRKTVPTERRMLVLQRLFHLAQGGCYGCSWGHGMI